MNIAKEIIDNQQAIASLRGTWEQHWDEIAKYMLQRQDDFFGTRQAGEKRTEYLFDSVGPMALDRCTAFIESLVAPRTSKWHGLTPSDIKLRKDLTVQAHYEQIRDELFRDRYSGGSNFSHQFYETLTSAVAFGTGVMSVEDVAGEGTRYKSLHLSEAYISENSHGIVDVIYRKFKLTGRNAIEFYGADLPSKIMEKAEKNPQEKFEFIHCVKPNKEYRRGSLNNKQFKYSSYHVAVDGAVLMREGGYRTFPYVIIRLFSSPNEVYARSPAMMALPEIKMVNQMRKTDLRARNLAVDAPILTADNIRVNLKPRAINAGALDLNGNPLIRPYVSGQQVELTNQSIEQSHEVINEAFFINLFQLVVDNPQMTATEVLERSQNKAAVLGPIGGRIQAEMSRMIERELDIKSMRGEIPEPPPQLRGQLSYEVEYTASINRMQKAEEALAVQRTVEATVPIAQIDPNVFAGFNWQEYVRIIGEANGTPASLFYTPEQMQVIMAQKQQEQQMAMMAQAAPQVAGAVKDIAQAQSYG